MGYYLESLLYWLATVLSRADPFLWIVQTPVLRPGPDPLQFLASIT